MVLVTHASALLGFTVCFTEFSLRSIIIFQATFMLTNDLMILAKVQNVCTFIVSSFCSLFIFRKAILIAMMCNWYSYIFPSLTLLYSSTFWLPLFQVLHYDWHSSGQPLLWSSWCCFRAWGLLQC